MAIWGQITVDELGIYSVSADPSADGFVAPIGSIALLDDDTNARMWIKSGAGNTAWSIVPRLANATALTVNRFVFPDASGFLTTTPRALWDGAGRFGFGLNAPAAPQSTIHLDRGNATGVHIRMTAGTTTGQATGDGTEFGIDDAGNAEIRQYENSPINFLTNNVRQVQFTAGGQVLIGTNAASQDISGLSTFPLLQIFSTGAFESQMAALQFSADANPAGLNILKSRGAVVNAQGLLQNNDELGRVQFKGSDGVGFQTGASVRAAVDGTASAGSMPSRLLLMTTPTGAVTPVERLRIDSTGQSIFSSNIRLGNGSDTTNGNIRFDGAEFLARQGNTWRNTAIAPLVATATANTSTTSATFTTIGDMTFTPGAGTYLVFFSCAAQITTPGDGDISLFVNGVENQSCRKNIGAVNTGLGGVSNITGELGFVSVVTVGAGQVIDARFRENDNDTLTISSRTMILIPIAR